MNRGGNVGLASEMMGFQQDGLGGYGSWKWVGVNARTNAKLEFCFSSTIQLLVYRWVVAVELDVGSSAVGETFECHSLVWLNS